MSGSDDTDDTGSVGDVIDGRYRLTDVLGDGGMGVVFRAQHIKLGRSVAIKLLHKDIAEQPGFKQRFEREAVAAGLTQHENIVTVSDFGELDSGALFLVMELLDGHSLGEELDKGAIDTERALRIARDVLRGLGHAHAAGIIHRDVKPDNIFLVGSGSDERAKLLDFGIAKLVDDAAELDDNRDLTQVGSTVGTPKFMSPEQSFGKAVDPSTDLYAMTVVLYFMLTGQPPYQAEEVIDLLMKHASAPIPSLGPYFSPALDAIMTRGMAKRSKDRFASAGEYLAALDALEDAAYSMATPAPVAPVASPPAAVPSSAPPTQVMSVGTKTVGVLGAMPDQLPPRARWGIAGGAGLAFIILLITASGDDTASNVAREESQKATAAPFNQVGQNFADTARAITDPGETETSKLAARLNDEGKHDEVRALFKDRRDLEPYERYELAVARAESRDFDRALLDFKAALEASPSLRTRKEYLTFARAMADNKSSSLKLDALELLCRYSDDKAARSKLADMASHNRKLSTRKRARALAETIGLRDELDLVASYSLDLNQERSCEDRRRALLRLEALGDVAALPAIKKSRRRMRGGIAGIGSKNSNHCLKDDAERIVSAYGDDSGSGDRETNR